MRILYRASVLVTAAFLLLFSFGCDTETGGGGGGGVTLNPEITLNIGTGLVGFNQELPVDTASFIVSITGNDGDALLRDLAILENGLTIPNTRLNFRTGQTSNNPILIPAGDQEGFTYEVEITPDVAAAGDLTYEFRLTDADGEVATTTVTISFVAPTTDLTFNMTGVFFNASGGGDGGLDLDNGMATTFNSPDAEIQDEGIDLNTAGENWRTQLSSVNDAVLRIADLSAIGEGLTFDEVLLTSQITAAFDGGSMPNGNDDFPDADGDVSSNEVVTQPLQVGDVLVIQRADRTYLVRIDEINFVDSSNTDNYVVSIKY